MQKQTIMRFVLVLVVAALTSTGLFVAAQGDRTNYGNTAQGEIAAAGETASWYFDGVSGDVITVEVARTGGNLIPAVSLAGPDNELIISLEWPEQGPPVVKFTTSLRVSGEHTVTISGHADTTGTYALTLELQEAGQPTTGNTGMLAYGRTVSGTITDTVFREFWSFRGTQGDVIDVLMTATSGDLDTFLTLSTPNGTLLIETNTGGAGQDAALYAVTLPVSGTYSITARRAGSNYGETGSSQGNYDLLLSLRRAGTDTGQPVPAGLALGTEMRGRLTADAPSAMYEVEAGGILSLGLDLLDPLHISTLTVMTPQRALLGTFLGIAPLRVSVAASGQSTVWIEIASAGLQENAPLDFALQVDRLNTATNASEPLLYGQSREIHEVVTHWHFAGQAGDQVEFALKPFGPAQGGLIQMFAPDGSQIVQRAVQTDLAQPLGLVANGIYEIVIDPVTAAGGYEIGVRRTGMAKRAFEQHSLPDDLGILEGGIAHTVSRELAPGESHIWSLDVTDSQVWMFQAEQVNGSAPLALVILSPGGHWMETATSDQLTNIASIQVKLPHAGRYQLLVFDPTGQTANAYTLWGAPVEGNLLALNTPAKGVLTSSQPRDVWQLRGVANTFLSLDVIVLRGAVPPSIHVIGPDNQEIIPVTTLKTVGIPLVESGLYTLIVEGLPTTYTIAADIAVPFAEDAGMRLTTNPLDSAVPELFVVDTAAPSPTQRVVLTDLITPHILPGDQAMGSASSLETNTLIRGEIAPDQLYQVWSLDAVASQMWSISVMPFGNGSIPDITLLDRAGRVIAEQLRPEGSTAHLTYRFSTGGLHYVVIRSINGGRYLLWAETFSGINERLPDVLLGEVIAYGDTQSGVLHQPEETAYFVFYGHTGDIIRASAAITQGDWPLTLKLLDTTGGVLAESDGLLENIRIPGDGIYRLAVQHTGTRSSPGGVFALHLNLEQAANTTTYSGGILINGRIAQLGANSAQHHWLFDASAGEQVTIRVEPLAPGAPTSLRLQLADTGGNVFLQQETNLGQGALQVANVLLPRAGVYQAI
ncbi:MAG: hypothetical protein JXQ72_14355, partial [Anaerolineae bacterium]|nr:hypothetical protein [Anaerolineae bacterium]